MCKKSENNQIITPKWYFFQKMLELTRSQHLLFNWFRYKEVPLILSVHFFLSILSSIESISWTLFLYLLVFQWFFCCVFFFMSPIFFVSSRAWSIYLFLSSNKWTTFFPICSNFPSSMSCLYLFLYTCKLRSYRHTLCPHLHTLCDARSHISDT